MSPRAQIGGLLVICAIARCAANWSLCLLKPTDAQCGMSNAMQCTLDATYKDACHDAFRAYMQIPNSVATTVKDTCVFDPMCRGGCFIEFEFSMPVSSAEEDRLDNALMMCMTSSANCPDMVALGYMTLDNAPTPAPAGGGGTPAPTPAPATPAPVSVTPAPAQSTPAPVSATPAPGQGTPAPAMSPPTPSPATDECDAPTILKVCWDAGQRCVDPSSAPGDWTCVCSGPSATGSATVAAATCTWEGECAQHADTCTAAGQICVDTDADPASLGNWVCRCPPPATGVDEAGAVAACTLDECVSAPPDVCPAGEMCVDPNTAHVSLNDTSCVGATDAPATTAPATTAPATAAPDTAAPGTAAPGTPAPGSGGGPSPSPPRFTAEPEAPSDDLTIPLVVVIVAFIFFFLMLGWWFVQHRRHKSADQELAELQKEIMAEQMMRRPSAAAADSAPAMVEQPGSRSHPLVTA